MKLRLFVAVALLALPLLANTTGCGSGADTSVTPPAGNQPLAEPDLGQSRTPGKSPGAGRDLGGN
jgi:hypothetical protein